MGSRRSSQRPAAGAFLNHDLGIDVLTAKTCKRKEGVGAEHTCPGTNDVADHFTKARFTKAIRYYERKLGCDQSTAINAILDAAALAEARGYIVRLFGETYTTPTREAAKTANLAESPKTLAARLGIEDPDQAQGEETDPQD